ncbi:hypothetical protein UFOVP155_34 [uncultured Caudovirales phage]|uniref:Uncharacterized protein n=1 Tax=uncultured Caudovirales phage TaxID=2100421 RepID=A0A6J7WFN7_9CAUD|nr:hypothetical protein UFOVP155_34 [uncultured Caudovirales phage]
MAHITADRVRDTSTTTSTGSFTVSGTAPTGFRTLSAVLSVGDTFYYAIQGQGTSEWEVGLGTYSSANVFARTTVLSSSNSGSAVTFSAGTKDVFLTLAASKTIQRDASGNVYDASGAGSDNIFFLNGTTVTTSYTLPTSYNAGTFGPVTVNSGVTVTIPSGSVWTVV